MTGVASLVRRLAEAGASPEVIAIAVEAVEAEHSAIAEQRAKAADRKRRQRENGTVTGQSRDSHGTHRDTPPCPPPFPPDPLNPPLNPPTPQKARERKATRLPADWEPTADDRTVARQEGLTDGECDREADKFRDYWTAIPGQRGVKRDWPATWRNWVRRRADERASNRGGGNSGGGGKEPRSRLADYAEVAAELDLQSRSHPGWGHTPRH